MSNFDNQGGLLKTLVVPKIGDFPGVAPTDSDYTYFQNLSRAVQGAKLQDNPMWNDAAELQQMKSLSYIMPIPGLNGEINDRLSKRFSLQDLNKPRDAMAVLQTAIRYTFENPFVAKAGRVKADFICQDFQHKTHNTKVKEFYDAQVDRLGLRITIRQIVWAMVTIGIVPIWWGGEEGGGINFIEILDPMRCHIEHNYGKPTLYLRIDPKMLESVNDPNGEQNPLNRARFRAMPKYWVDQIRDQKHNAQMGLIELQPGSYTVIENKYSRFSRPGYMFDGIPLQGCFDALQKYRLLSAGDFATAWSLKNFITIISEGDPKLENGGKSWTPVSTQRLAQLQQHFQRPDTNFTVYADPTTQIRYFFPPVEIFDTKKYHQPEKEIKDVLNLPSFMWAQDLGTSGGTYEDATSQLRMFRLEVDAIRLILEEQFFKPLYERLREAARGRGGFKQSDIVYPSYNKTSLQDDVTWFANVSDLYGRGAISLQSLQSAYGFDHNYEMEQMKIEHDLYGNESSGEPGEPLNDTIASPLFEPSQGNMNPARDKGGNEGTPSAKPRNPRKTGK